MKKETVRKFFEFLEKKEGKENIRAKLIFSPESLPKGFVVKGSLDLKGFPIQSLPEGLKVEGSLNLQETPIQSLPEGLEVGGVLWLYNTPIQSLPEGLIVGMSLYLRDTPLSRKYTQGEIQRMIESTGGYVRRKIYL